MKNSNQQLQDAILNAEPLAGGPGVLADLLELIVEAGIKADLWTLYREVDTMLAGEPLVTPEIEIQRLMQQYREVDNK